MKNYFLNLAFLLVLLSTYSEALEYVVISNKTMQKLSLSQIKAIFLKKANYINDTKVLPVNLSSRDSIRANFEKNILKMNFLRLRSYWTQQHYMGQRPPITMKSQQAVKTFVKKVDGAIGYIEMKNLDKSVKVIYRWKD